MQAAGVKQGQRPHAHTTQALLNPISPTSILHVWMQVQHQLCQHVDTQQRVDVSSALCLLAASLRAAGAACSLGCFALATTTTARCCLALLSLALAAHAPVVVTVGAASSRLSMCQAARTGRSASMEVSAWLRCRVPLHPSAGHKRRPTAIIAAVPVWPQHAPRQHTFLAAAPPPLLGLPLPPSPQPAAPLLLAAAAPLLAPRPCSAFSASCFANASAFSFMPAMMAALTTHVVASTCSRQHAAATRRSSNTPLVGVAVVAELACSHTTRCVCSAQRCKLLLPVAPPPPPRNTPHAPAPACPPCPW